MQTNPNTQEYKPTSFWLHTQVSMFLVTFKLSVNVPWVSVSSYWYLVWQSSDLRLHYAQWDKGIEMKLAQLSAACRISGIIKGLHHVSCSQGAEQSCGLVAWFCHSFPMGVWGRRESWMKNRAVREDSYHLIVTVSTILGSAYPLSYNGWWLGLISSAQGKPLSPVGS